MSGADLILAAMLLTTPAGTPAPCFPPADWVNVRDAVHTVAVQWEILDPREARYTMSKPEDFCADLNMLRRRHADLADAPTLADGLRLPDQRTAAELVRFNRAFRRSILARQQLEIDRAETLAVVVWENDQLYKVWDAVGDARNESSYVTNRRQALKKLRTLVGEEAFQTGDLPPNVPTWRFTEMAH